MTPERVKDPNRHTGRAKVGCQDRNDGDTPRMLSIINTLGFSSSCSCNADTIPGTVLDPFSGAGTTGLVADRLGRNAIGIELNPQYAAMAESRIRNDAPLFAEVSA